MIPALLLPVIAAAIAIIAGQTRTGADNGVGGIILVVYMFVLLGSMTLNAWLLLRHPQTLSERSLPWSSSVVLVALWALLIAWGIVLAVPAFGDIDVWLSLAFAIICIVASVVSFFLAATRRVAPADRVPRTDVQLGSTTRVALWIYVVASGIAVLAYVAFSVLGSSPSDAGGALGGPSTWALLVLGLPWSHTLYFVSVLASFTLPSIAGVVGIGLATVAPVLAVAANVAIALVLLLSPERRTRIVNWFFRLTPKPAGTPEPAPPL